MGAGTGRNSILIDVFESASQYFFALSLTAKLYGIKRSGSGAYTISLALLKLDH
jgi:hypothetical protein